MVDDRKTITGNANSLVSLGPLAFFSEAKIKTSSSQQLEKLLTWTQFNVIMYRLLISANGAREFL